MASSSWMLAFASIFTVISLAMIAISFSTDNWIDVTVKRDQVTATDKTKSYFFTRHRGLFRTCYEGNETVFLDNNPDKTDGNCLVEKGYELKRSEDTVDYGDDYEARIHLMRSHFGFLILAMLFLVIGCFIAIAGCWRFKPFVLQVGGLVVFVGAFLGAAGMAFFHGFDYLEREKLGEIEGMRRYIQLNEQSLYENSRWSYGFSYILGWIGVGCAAIGAVLFLLAAMSISNRQREEERAEKRRERKYKESVMDAMYGGYENGGYGGYPGYAGYPGYSYGTDPYAMSMYNAGTYKQPPASGYPAITY